MSELYIVTVTTGTTSFGSSTSGYPFHASEYIWDTSYNRCPIDDSPGYACFEIPGGFNGNHAPYAPAN
jgi:hypothetical protein